jgi:DNA polymerase-3 subunit delta'
MTNAPNAIAVLGGKLCPWLEPAFARLDAAIATGRLGHAWLIHGPTESGKINLALAVALRLLGIVEQPVELSAAEAAAAIAHRHEPADRHPDLHWLFPLEDKATISVEQVREVIDALALTAHGGGAKVVIVEPADALTTAAANALLKTLEEPSAGTYLLLLSHELGHLPATIRSRCQRLAVSRPSFEAIDAWLGGGPKAAEAWHLAGGAPLRAAAIVSGSDPLEVNDLSDSIRALSEDRASPQAVAERWAKSDSAAALTWLMRELHTEIRSRLAAAGSTAVTDPKPATLHNACRKLTLKTLFELYDRAERLLGQAGSGVNQDLSLQALFGGFVTNDKGRV